MIPNFNNIWKVLLGNWLWLVINIAKLSYFNQINPILYKAKWIALSSDEHFTKYINVTLFLSIESKNQE